MTMATPRKELTGLVNRGPDLPTVQRFWNTFSPRAFRGSTCQLQMPSLKEQGISLLDKVTWFAGKVLSIAF